MRLLAINDILSAISQRIYALTAGQQSQLGITSWYYNASTDEFIIEMPGLSSEKEALFKKWVADRTYIRLKDSAPISKGGVTTENLDPGAEGIAQATGGVSVRSGPDTKYSKVGKLKKGDAVEVISSVGKWLQIQWADGTAYVYKSYFVYQQKGAAAATADANIRSGPGTSYKIIGGLNKGQTVEVSGTDGDWARISWVNNEPGYVHTKYLAFAR